MSQPTNSTFGWFFLLQWMFLTLLAIAVATLIAINTNIKVTPFPFVFIILTQGIISIAQSQALKRRVSRAIWWIPASFLGSCLGSSIWLWCFLWEIPLYLVKTLIGLLFYSVTLGYIQWFVLKEYIPKAFLWIKFTIIGLMISLIISLIERSINGGVGLYPTALDWIVLNIAYGFIQAISIIILLRRYAFQRN